MFVGSLNADMRAIFAEMATDWRDRQVYIGCSGNMTIERILAKAGVRSLHSNDVSLYSCALGSYLTGKPIEVGIKHEDFKWLSNYLAPGIPTIATLLMCSEYLQYVGRDTPYHKRMSRAYFVRWELLYAATIERVKAAVDGIQVSSFWAGDVVDFAEQAPDDAVFVTYPPTYKGGYERLYRMMDAVFAWDAPAYTVFDDERFNVLVQAARQKATWVIVTDKDLEDLHPFCVGRVQTSAARKPVYVYAANGDTALAVARQKTEPVRVPRLECEVGADDKLVLIELTRPQFDALRAQYLNPTIVPASSALMVGCYGVVCGGRLVGAFAIGLPSLARGHWQDAYLVTDFSVAPSPYARLSKLVLSAVVSVEARQLLESILKMPVRTIGTTVFTDKPVSMKYRGLFSLHDRQDDRLHYVAEAGKWTLQEGFDWWKRLHSQTLTD